MGCFGSHLFCRVPIYWTVVVFMFLSVAFFFSVLGSGVASSSSTWTSGSSTSLGALGLPTEVEGNGNGDGLASRACQVLSLSFLSPCMRYKGLLISPPPVNRSPVIRSCRPQPRGSRREVAHRKDMRQDCRSYVNQRRRLRFFLLYRCRLTAQRVFLRLAVLLTIGPHHIRGS